MVLGEGSTQNSEPLVELSVAHCVRCKEVLDPTSGSANPGGFLV